LDKKYPKEIRNQITALCLSDCLNLRELNCSNNKEIKITGMERLCELVCFVSNKLSDQEFQTHIEQPPK